MDLIEKNIYSELNFYQYKDDKNKTSFKIKYPIYFTDTISEINKKIYLSLNDKYTPNENFIFSFTQMNIASENQLKKIEEKIIPNKTLRDLLKENFHSLDKIDADDNLVRNFIKTNKDILKKEIGTGIFGYLISKAKEFKTQINILTTEKYSQEDLLQKSICLSHYFHELHDIKFNIMMDTKIDSELINKDQSVKFLNIISKLETNLLTYDSISTIYFITFFHF